MNLINTNVFRMALGFALLFIIIAATSLASVYYITFKEIEEQTDRELRHELTELEAEYALRGLDSLSDLIGKREHYGRHLHHYYALLSKDNKRNQGNLTLLESVVSSPFYGEDQPIRDKPHYFYIEAGHEDVIRVAFKVISPDLIVIAGLAQQSITELREHVLTAIFFAVFITILFALITGFYMGKRVLHRIHRLDSDLAFIISNDFKNPLSIPDSKDEFHELTHKLNSMISQVGNLISGMKQVTDNIAHDLRSPLTRLRNKLEVTLLQSRNTDEYKQAMESAINDCNVILQTFNALLSIARAEAGVRNQDWSLLSLSHLLDELIELYSAVAEDKHIALKATIAPEIHIEGNRQILAQAFSNLIENAIKFTPENGHIQITLEMSGQHINMSVCDDGPGIPEKDKERVIERFQRLDAARSTPGSGLGLSLVQAVAKLHNAALILEDNQPGLCARIRFTD